MKDRVCLITGCTQGIGRAAALELGRAGAHLLLVARSRERGQAVLDEIQAANPEAKAELLLADLSARSEIRRLADEVNQRRLPLHVLVNNAGGINMRRQTTVDGFELTFATNHLAYFLLTHLLLERLVASAPARIVNVASNAHNGGEIRLDDLQLTHGFTGWKAYSQSKLANVLFTYELARRLDGKSVTANCLHPGVVATGFGHGQPFLGFFVKLGRPFLLTPEKGARTLIYLASSPEVEGVTGKYFVKCKERRSSQESYDEALARKLWAKSAELVEIPA